MAVEEGALLWRGSPEFVEQSNMVAFIRWLAHEHGLSFENYEALRQWSVADIESFWARIWDYFNLQSDAPYARVLTQKQMPGARWFEGARVNFAEHFLRNEAATPDAIVPVLVLDINEQEANVILLTLDPLSAMAESTAERLNSLLAEAETGNEATRSMWEGLAREYETASDTPAESTDRPEVNIPESYQVVVECRDETDQEHVYARMRDEGYRCRVLTL